MQLIETKTLGTSQTTISFSSIPQTFTDLYLVFSLRVTDTSDAGGSYYTIAINGGGTSTTTRYMQGNGASGSAAAGPLNGLAGVAATNASTANTFCTDTLYLPNYRSSTAKSYSVDSASENDATRAFTTIVAGQWNNTAAITSLAFTPSVGDFMAGSTISLYGIGGVGDGGPKATGGIITKSGNYWVHTFTASGTFSPLQNLSNVEYVVVGGGGGGAGGAGRAGGGGGAGGYRSSVVGESSGGGTSAEATLSLTANTNYTVTIGAGGARGVAPSTITATSGTTGNASIFGTITSNGGGGGGGTNADAIPGASGGGGLGSGGWNGLGNNGGLGTAGQGFNGGQGFSSTSTHLEQSGGAGGGAGAAGGNGSASAAGIGGNGVASSITGSSITRAGGGGGTRRAGSGGAGGAGGGGQGRVDNDGQAGFDNTGGGGGAGVQDSGTIPPGRTGGNGGSGIVIVRYAA